MSNSDKDQNIMKSFVKLTPCRSTTTPLQDRRLTVNNGVSSPICEINDSNSGARKPEKQREEGNYGEKENICDAAKPFLKLKLPSKTDQDYDDDDGFKTPTSSEQRIPAIATCPPAPRKPKAAPAMKRRAPRRRALLDLSNEIELLFPPMIRNNNVKKIRQ